jgi:hypothetical protein
MPSVEVSTGPVTSGADFKTFGVMWHAGILSLRGMMFARRQRLEGGIGFVAQKV